MATYAAATVVVVVVVVVAVANTDGTVENIVDCDVAFTARKRRPTTVDDGGIIDTDLLTQRKEMQKRKQ